MFFSAFRIISPSGSNNTLVSSFKDIPAALVSTECIRRTYKISFAFVRGSFNTATRDCDIVFIQASIYTVIIPVDGLLPNKKRVFSPVAETALEITVGCSRCPMLEPPARPNTARFFIVKVVSRAKTTFVEWITTDINNTFAV
jgi:hypothetical protein